MCPHLEKADPRCAAHLSLEHLEEAMCRCAYRYEDCPVYRKLLVSDAATQEHVEPVRAAG
jgi:hypothetical protein